MGFFTSRSLANRTEKTAGAARRRAGQAVEEDLWLQGRNKGDDITGWLQKRRDLQTRDRLMTLYDPPESFMFPNYVSVETASLQPTDGCGEGSHSVGCSASRR